MAVKLVHECDICGFERAANDMPTGWGYVMTVTDYLTCDKCVTRWQERFNETPKMWNGEEEL